MVKIGQPSRKTRRTHGAIRSIPFSNPSFPTLGVEAFSLAEVRARDRSGHLRELQRPNFHVLIYVIAGHGIHHVDFASYECKPGTLLMIHPGQVQKFADDENLQADLLIFAPEFPSFESSQIQRDGLQTDPLSPIWKNAAPKLPAGDLEQIRESWTAIEREYRSTDGSRVSASILKHLLRALLLQIARACMDEVQSAKSSRAFGTYRRFILELEKEFARRRKVEDYANKLGCSAKTLNRACIASSGVPPKELIERRVLLEAKRLLVHTDLSIAAIGMDVGFEDVTNFVKFFRRCAGVTPVQFRKVG